MLMSVVFCPRVFWSQMLVPVGDDGGKAEAGREDEKREKINQPIEQFKSSFKKEEEKLHMWKSQSRTTAASGDRNMVRGLMETPETAVHLTDPELQTRLEVSSSAFRDFRLQ